MSDAVHCEYCVNYSYDDDYECYTCEVNLDEDEMVKFPPVPIFQNGRRISYRA